MDCDMVLKSKVFLIGSFLPTRHSKFGLIKWGRGRGCVGKCHRKLSRPQSG